MVAARKKSRPSRFKSGGSGARERPRLTTTVSTDTDERLRAYVERTGVPMGQVLDRAVALYLDEVMK